MVDNTNHDLTGPAGQAAKTEAREAIAKAMGRSSVSANTQHVTDTPLKSPYQAAIDRFPGSSPDHQNTANTNGHPEQVEDPVAKAERIRKEALARAARRGEYTLPPTNPSVVVEETTRTGMLAKAGRFLGKAKFLKFGGVLGLLGLAADASTDALGAVDAFKHDDVKTGKISAAGVAGTVVGTGAGIVLATALAPVIGSGLIASGIVVGGTALASNYLFKKGAENFATDGKTMAQHDTEYQQALGAFKAAVLSEHQSGAAATKEQHDAVGMAREELLKKRRAAAPNIDDAAQVAAIAQLEKNLHALAEKQAQDEAQKLAAAQLASLQVTAVGATAAPAAVATTTERERPAAAPTTPAASTKEGYTVKSGDTLYGIAQKVIEGSHLLVPEGMDKENFTRALVLVIASKNRIDNANNIDNGQHLDMPSLNELNARLAAMKNGVLAKGFIANSDFSHVAEALPSQNNLPTATATRSRGAAVGSSA